MGIKTKPTYTEQEVSRILRESEEESVSDTDLGEGHAESAHELKRVGKHRASTTTDSLLMRVVGPELLSSASAFDGCQVAAIVYALNMKAGQTALNWLCMNKAQAIFARINIKAGNFRILAFSSDVTAPAPSGARFVVGPGGYKATFEGVLIPINGIAEGIGIKLLKTPTRNLHIRTAFPYIRPIGQSTARITWIDRRVQTEPLPV